MPELPEVETTVKGLSVIKDQKINSINIYTKKLLITIELDFLSSFYFRY